MSIINQLASSLQRRDEVPNQELAKAIVKRNDAKAVQELMDLFAQKNKALQSDSIKVIYEIAEVKPALIKDHAATLLTLLDHPNNRIQWGVMMALDYITLESPELIYKKLTKIIAVADKGSVITNDHCVGILIKLCSYNKYITNAFPLLIERIRICPTNQLAMYSERSLPIINETNKAQFVKTLTTRLPEIEKESKRLRVEKLLRKLAKG